MWRCENNQILFTNKDDTQVYKTGLMDDPDLIYRLKDSGAEFSSEIVEQMSPFLSFLLTWLLPIVFFVALGQFMLKRMTSKAGGPNSMMFGLGGSNAKVYVKSAEGIKFSDVAGEDEAKENLTEIVDYLHDPAKYHGHRRVHAQGHPARRPSGNRQDDAGQSRRRRGERAVLLHLRFGIRGDVRRHGREQGA